MCIYSSLFFQTLKTFMLSQCSQKVIMITGRFVRVIFSRFFRCCHHLQLLITITPGLKGAWTFVKQKKGTKELAPCYILAAHLYVCISNWYMSTLGQGLLDGDMDDSDL